MAIYVVRPGDSVDAIAEALSVSVNTIIYDNQLVVPYALAVGQALFIEEGAPPRQKPSIKTNGYAYPYISPWALEQTLPFLTELSIFSYGFGRTGDLLAPSLPDEWMIQAAWENGARPILTLTPLDERGQFNNNLITSVVNNFSYKTNLIAIRNNAEIYFDETAMSPYFNRIKEVP